MQSTRFKSTISHEYLPPVNRKQKTLDRKFFRLDIPLVVAKLQDLSVISKLGKYSKSDLFDLPSINRIRYFEEDKSKGILLRNDIRKVETVPEKLSPGTLELLKSAGAKFEPFTLTLTYDYWNADQILKSVLPENLAEEIPSGFTIVGHIAHMNLRSEYLPYKGVIGQVILDKNRKQGIRTVVNKLDTIDNVYRNFKMEVLAGDKDFVVKQKESDCLFTFDFSQVYWNSRLQAEHNRLVKLFKQGEVICDVFAGAGPFAVPAGKKNSIVLANDLNPAGFAALKDNITSNKVDDFVTAFNMDGEDFIRQSPKLLRDLGIKHKAQIAIQPKRISRSKPMPPPTIIPIPTRVSHYVMNLPDSALSFLHAFKGLYADEESLEDLIMPMIHVHCFYKWATGEPRPGDEIIFSDLLDIVKMELDCNMLVEDVTFHDVRSVSPTKSMYCLSFRLPKEAATKIN